MRVSQPSHHRDLTKTLATALAILGLAMALGCSPAEEGSSGSAEGTVEAGAETAAADTAAAEGKGELRHRPITRLGKARSGRGNLKLVYGRLSQSEHQELEKVFKEERFFEDILDNLNQSLILPRNLPVRLEECGEVNASYDPNDGSITLCYELLGHFLELFGNQVEEDSDEAQEEAASKAVAALVFAFYHELGHALIDVYDLPATGREEDAVDQLATVMLLETWDGEESELAILSSAEWFDLDASESEEDPDMADEHSLDQQRYYNLVCWIYGSDTEYFSDVVDDWELPPARAERCEGEYERMSGAWNSLLGPHMKAEEE
jgi:Putative metallopeptidase